MKDFKKLREEALRQQQRHEEVFKEGDAVMSSRTGIKGHIHRVGGNYAIVISEDGDMFREWMKNIRSCKIATGCLGPEKILPRCSGNILFM